MTAAEIIEKYIAFFTARGHVQIANSSLVPENDPTTLFTSSGMQPLVPYLLGEEHPAGKRLVNVQNSFRAQDIDEIGDNRHTTFFRMLGNWSLGDYFKKEQIPWFWEFLTKELGLPKERLYVTVFEGGEGVEKDTEAVQIWTEVFEKEDLDHTERIFYYGVDKNWWSRSGVPKNMPVGEPGGPDSEVFFEFDIPHDPAFGEKCHVNCDCGKYLEIGNSVFMQFKKGKNGFEELPQQNVDFGGGLERLLAAQENTPDVFMCNLFKPVIDTLVSTTGKKYQENAREMRIVTDHMLGAVFITSNGIYPSNKEQGYILRRLIRRGLDNFYALNGKDIEKVLESIVDQYKDTDPVLIEKYEHIKGVILEEEQSYKNTMANAKQYLEKRYSVLPKGETQGDALKGVTEITAEDAFKLYTSYGLSPTQIKSLGYTFKDQEFAEKMTEHAKVSRAGADKKFKGGLADTSEKTIHGHTVTHLLHKALRDMFGERLQQRGSNITPERVRFDFNFDRKLTSEEIQKVEEIVNKKIKESLPVFYKILPLEEGKKVGAIGLFGEKYEEQVKVYFVGGSQDDLQSAYSKEFCGGPHVENTAEIGSFKITKEEGLGKGIRRIYSVVE
ncbi:MAG TPA: alanine--tRNA ligase [Candidatus Levybacteria bacterium]|nr:alanine--tRNA ligase [Candidatus Levybacteria bacterium]